ITGCERLPNLRSFATLRMTKTPIRVSLCRDGSIEQGDERLIDKWRADSDDKLWVDIQEPTQEILEPLLEKRFGFHELAAEDSLSPNTLPKYDAFPKYDFFIFRAVQEKLNTKLAAFLCRNFLFTVHREVLAPIDHVCNRLPSDVRLLSNGVDFMLYSIVDEMVDAYFPLLEEI